MYLKRRRKGTVMISVFHPGRQVIFIAVSFMAIIKKAAPFVWDG
jgi:hypothetical protein